MSGGTFGFLNPFVQSRWKERAAKHNAEARKRRNANSPDRSGEAIETTEIGSTEGESRK